MRIYKDCKELISEIYRDVFEMGTEVATDTMQNKVIKDNPDFLTKEIINYSYCLMSLDKVENLFLADDRMPLYCRVELEARVSPYYQNPGGAFLCREDVWKPFLNRYAKFDYTYNERIRKQLEQILDELSARPNTRQAILSIWDPNIDIENLGGIKRVPCSIYYQFLIREGRLNIIYNMRSCDVVTHFGVDVWLAYSLMTWVANYLEIQPGYLYHNITSLHCYKKDWEKLKQCIDANRKG